MKNKISLGTCCIISIVINVTAGGLMDEIKALQTVKLHKH